MNNNFTHILCVKLLNTETNETMIDDFVLNAIKEIITSATQIETFPYNNNHDIEVLINWKFGNWTNNAKYFHNGDLTTRTEYDDKIVKDHTTKMLLGIETYFKTKYAPINGDKWTIIFNIVKPAFLFNFGL
jgi:hypothetical protein